MKKLVFIAFASLIFSCTDLKKEYHSNGNLKSECEIKNEKKDGQCRYFDELGVLIQENNYKDGIKHGEGKGYYSSGELQWKCNYVDGEEEGKYEEFYQSGKIKTISFFHYGTQHGNTKEYFENGKLKSDGSYEMGVSKGELKTYYQNGQLEMEAFYGDDSLVEYSIKYDSLGNWTDEYRFLIVEYSDTIVLGNNMNIEIEMLGPGINAQDSSVIFFDIYDPITGNQYEELNYLLLEKNDFKYKYEPDKVGTYAFSGLIITNSNNNKRKSHKIEPTILYVVESNER